mmetsp:Transcript_27244/g.40226  ORF Transcript_27244/g.40226 Transcript_27244/m.40226 type:complete len:187 (+) Transcript_27244:72-632(+)|eukprot:CAMPEP_0194215766 /NCGR_PEP_ID=MMETSP0156-20130528/17784_1 /TAXON_ID=33649 /ORGANISM="Thalassionema nitzschioides, Strain L26-B" /LENGTH=186 /DNA_ID=CAMNT_0038944369 /DNA_START=64 /DNA_END=624 /DNA_ORIENTATION=-
MMEQPYDEQSHDEQFNADDHEAWEKNFQLLVEYKKQEGHCNVPRVYKFRDVRLGHWVNRQRTGKKWNFLEEYQIERLESIGFEWELHPEDALWKKQFQLLVEFKELEGHCNVPYNYEVEGKQLGHWVQEQRERFYEEDNNTMKEYQIRRLESIGFEWGHQPLHHDDAEQDSPLWESCFQIIDICVY